MHRVNPARLAELRYGDWIVPRQQGEPFLYRPPCGSWSMALFGLVRGQVDGGAYGEVLAGRGGLWHDPGKPYFADAGTLTLGDVNADGVPDVIVVRHECPGAESGTPKCEAAPVLAQVYDLGGETLGCTRKVTSPSDLRGWPEVRLTRADLRSC